MFGEDIAAKDQTWGKRFSVGLMKNLYAKDKKGAKQKAKKKSSSRRKSKSAKKARRKNRR